MNEDRHENDRYPVFFAMIGTAMVAMFLMTYLNSEQILDHAWFSETRLYMTLMMGGSMTLIMLFFMRSMYRRSGVNVAIVIAALVLFFGALGLVRSQVLVDDVDYMEGMIPHHSIAVLTSTRAQIADRRVRDLADAITDAQRREIKEMEWLIEDIRANGPATTDEAAASRPVPKFDATPE